MLELPNGAPDLKIRPHHGPGCLPKGDYNAVTYPDYRAHWLASLRKLFRCGATRDDDGSVPKAVQQRRQREEMSRVEDEIMTKRDQLVDQLEKRLAGRTTVDALFTIRWTVA